MVAENLTDFQLGILLVGVLFVICLTILGLFLVSRRYPKETTKLDPIYKGVFIILLIFLVHVTVVIFTDITTESLTKAVKWYVIATILLVAFYGFVLPYILRKPKSTIKLLNEYVIPDARKLYGGDVYKGVAAVPLFLFSRVVPSAYSKYLQELGQAPSLVEVFLIRMVYGGKGTMFDVLEIRDKFTGEGLEHHKNPPLSILNDLLGREVARSYEKPSEEYETHEEKIAPRNEA